MKDCFRESKNTWKLHRTLARRKMKHPFSCKYGIEFQICMDLPFLPGKNLEIMTKETITTVFDKIYRGSMPQMIIDPELTQESYLGEWKFFIWLYYVFAQACEKHQPYINEWSC